MERADNSGKSSQGKKQFKARKMICNALYEYRFPYFYGHVS
mgnify:CR=1 FL=1